MGNVLRTPWWERQNAGLSQQGSRGHGMAEVPVELFSRFLWEMSKVTEAIVKDLYPSVYRLLRNLYSAASVLVTPTYRTWRVYDCRFCKRKKITYRSDSFHAIHRIRPIRADAWEKASIGVTFGWRFGCDLGCICSVSQARQEGSRIRIESTRSSFSPSRSSSPFTQALIWEGGD